MLVLSRKMGESVVLPECRVKFTVIRVSGQRVRLGIDAPATTTVHRQETWERIQERLPAIAKMPAPVAGRIEVVWFDDGQCDNDQYATDPQSGEGVCITVVRSLGACVEELVSKRPDLLVLDVDAARGHPQTVLQFLRRDRSLALLPVMLIGNAMPHFEQEYGVTVVDRLNKPITAEQLSEGVTALFAYSNWRRAVTKEEWHRDSSQRVQEKRNGKCISLPTVGHFATTESWHSPAEAGLPRPATRH